jgi:hypothetical protein
MTLFWNSGAIARFSGNSAKKKSSFASELRAAIAPLFKTLVDNDLFREKVPLTDWVFIV